MLQGQQGGGIVDKLRSAIGFGPGDSIVTDKVSVHLGLECLPISSRILLAGCLSVQTCTLMCCSTCTSAYRCCHLSRYRMRLGCRVPPATWRQNVKLGLDTRRSTRCHKCQALEHLYDCRYHAHFVIDLS